MIIIYLFLAIIFFTNYFKWNVAITFEFKSFSFFDELFSILLIVISCFILYIWTLLYENEIKIGKLSIHYILVSTALILTIIFYILKIIVLRKGKKNTKILFLSLSTFIELVIMVLIGIDTFNIL